MHTATPLARWLFFCPTTAHLSVLFPHQQLPRLYTELADWWPILSAPADYAEEAEFYRQALLSKYPGTPKTMLELGFEYLTVGRPSV